MDEDRLKAEKILKRLKASLPDGPFGDLNTIGQSTWRYADGCFLAYGAKNLVFRYLIFSALPFGTVLIDDYSPYGSKFPGVLVIKSSAMEIQIALGSLPRFIKVEKNGTIVVKDINLSSDEIRAKIQPYANRIDNKVMDCLWTDLAPWVIEAQHSETDLESLIGLLVPPKKPAAPSQKPVFSFHEPVNERHWVSFFPMEKERERAREFVLEQKKKRPGDYRKKKDVEDHVRIMSPQADSVTGPYHVAMMEQLRKEAKFKGLPLSRVPTDVMCFNLGEAPLRTATKIGGLPYWPADLPWPQSKSGGPLMFLAQFNFKDSQEITGSLPGELLLIFCEPEIEEYGFMGDGEDDFRMFWRKLGDGKALIEPDQVPEGASPIAPCWAAIHRSFDLVEEEPLSDKVLDKIEPILVWKGTKIGGEPNWLQEPDFFGLQHLCTLGSIHPQDERAYPFLNVAKPFNRFSRGKKSQPPDDLLMFGDVGSLIIFLHGDGALSWVAQCY